MLKYLLPAVAVVGLIFGLYVVHSGAKPVPVANAVAEPSRPSFKHYIAGAGIVEASTENIVIGTFVPGVVVDVPVRVGRVVNKGEVLFRLDTRDLEAESAVRKAALGLAKVKVPEVEANLGDVRKQLELYRAVSDERAITREELSKRTFAVTAAQARLEQAKADLVSSEAMVAQTQIEIERRVVRAPVHGEVLQVKIHPGEYAQVGPLATPLMVLGDTDTLNVRIDIDENDAWRFRADARAKAYIRGNPALSTDLVFSHIEPYVIPKKSLTGDTTERVDTRVLQVLYAFPKERLPMIHVGQQMDAFVDVQDDVGSTSRPAGGARPASAVSSLGVEQ